MFSSYLGELGGNLSNIITESAGKLAQAKLDKEIARHTTAPETTVQPNIPGKENPQLVKGVNSDGSTMVAGQVGKNQVTNKETPFYKTKPFVYGASGVGLMLAAAVAYRIASN